MSQQSYHELDLLTLNTADLGNSIDNPIYRKATINMVLANQTCFQLIEKYPTLLKSQISFVLGTAFGEVESSMNFLKTQKVEGIARPNLFQNSLHNSTLGFVSVQLGLTGPALTVSSGDNTRQAAILTAETLLQITDYVLICLIDVVPKELESFYCEIYPKMQPYIGQATAILWQKKV